MIALCTGSSGFVGRHMVTALQARGYDVIGVDIATPTPGSAPDVFVHEDARSYFNCYATDDFDLVVHCAAVVGGRTMIDGDPLLLAVEDLSLDAALFRWALRARPGRIVAFSSSAAYPTWAQSDDAGELTLYENLIDPDDASGTPDQTYGWVKLTLERLAAEANAEGIRTHVFRPFSGYGADQALDYPFPAIIERARLHAKTDRAFPGADEPFTVWGDPGSARDWVHIDDVVGCVLAAIDADDIGPMNICTGRATTFRELATLALAAAGARPTEIVGDTSKPTGVFWRVGDPERMHQVYRPTITLEEGIARAMAEKGR